MPQFLFDGSSGPHGSRGRARLCSVDPAPAHLGQADAVEDERFDLVITVALGSMLATILLSKYVSLARGTVALGLLVALQFVITWSAVRLRWVRAIVTGEPVLLADRGQLLATALRDARVTEEEVKAAARSAGLAGLQEAEAIVLETDGSFSVVRRPDGADRSALEPVRGIASVTPSRGARHR